LGTAKSADVATMLGAVESALGPIDIQELCASAGEGGHHRQRRFGEVEECADVAVLLAGNGYITGQTIGVNGGLSM
jgi:hypothetical protein